MTLKETLLAKRRIDYIDKSNVGIPSYLYDTLLLYPSALNRLYEYCLQKNDGKHQFDVDENIFLFEVFINDKLVYSLDRTNDQTIDETQPILDADNDPTMITEVYINKKLFVFLQGTTIFIQNFGPNNISIFNDLNTIPGWVKLSGGDSSTNS